MAEQSLSLFDRFRSISSQPVAMQIRLLLGITASIVLVVSIVDWALTPDFTPLYGELSPASATEVIKALEAENVRYEVDSRSGLISVPNDVVREMRLRLAGEHGT